MSTENWKYIIGFDDKYQISDLGRVKNDRGMILKPQKHRKGYCCIRFCVDYNKRSKKIHRLVAQAFIPNPENKPQVNHKNGIKTDNRVENLEWATQQENINHAIKNNLWKPDIHAFKKGEGNTFSKLNDKQVLEIRSKFIPRVYTRKMLAKEYGVKESCIKDVVLRKSWNHI